jgi:hypothetical protein
MIQFWKGNGTDYNVVSLVFSFEMVKDLVGFMQGWDGVWFPGINLGRD